MPRPDGGRAEVRAVRWCRGAQSAKADFLRFQRQVFNLPWFW